MLRSLHRITQKIGDPHKIKAFRNFVYIEYYEPKKKIRDIQKYSKLIQIFTCNWNRHNWHTNKFGTDLDNFLLI